MNKIYLLLDKDYVFNLFEKKIPIYYPKISKIERIEINYYKKLIWETTYHVVFSYDLFWLDKNGKEKKIQIVCSAHSSEPRENVLDNLNYLWEKGLPSKEIKLPRPLFYLKDFRATFYCALPGETLLHYIKKSDKIEISSLVSGAAKMFAKLHQLPIDENFKYDFENQKISSVVPGEKFIYPEVRRRFKESEYLNLIELYESCVSSEEKLFPEPGNRALIHGDAHPENVIRVGSNKIGLIDFTDFSPADYARDLGAFIQQIEYKIVKKVADLEFAREMKNLFLEEYLRAANIRLDNNLQERINLYYDWTALRTTVYWFLNYKPSVANGQELIGAINERRKTGRNAQDLMIHYKQ